MFDENPVLRAIASRASVRSYEDKPVPREAVEAMLRAAMAAPTAKDARPWCFLATADRAKLAALAEVLPYGKMLAHAPMAIMIGADLEAAEAATPGFDYWIQDCSAATMNMLLAAEAVGLGAVWLGVTPIPDRIANVGRILALPDSVTPLCIVGAGYPKAAATAKDKYDPAKVHWEKW